MTLRADDPSDPTTPVPGLGARAERLRWRVRRTVLRRRRPLAALLACLALGTAMTTLSAPDAASEPVLVVARDLPAGVTLGPEDLETVDFRPGTPPAGALRDAGSATGRILAAPMTAGEPVTPVRLVGSALASAQPGRRAVPLRLPDPGMVGLLEVGDRIDLLATDPEDGTVATVATGVPVLALPAADAGGQATASGLPGGLLIVGLSPAEVAPVAAASLSSFVTYTWSER